MSPSPKPRYKGVFPSSRPLDYRGALDLDSQKRCVDFMIAPGRTAWHLANFSEQFRSPTTSGAAQAAILGTWPGGAGDRDHTHFSSRVCAERSPVQEAGRRW